MTIEVAQKYFSVPTVIDVPIPLNSTISEFTEEAKQKGYDVVFWDENNRYHTYVIVEKGIAKENINRSNQLAVLLSTPKGTIVKVTYGNSIGTNLTKRLEAHLGLKGKQYSHYLSNHIEDLLLILEGELGLPENSLLHIPISRFVRGKSVHLECYVMSKDSVHGRHLLMTILVNSFENYCLADFEIITKKRALKYIECSEKS